MKTRIEWIIPLMGSLLLAGCTAVYSPKPVGSEVVTLDPAEWEGSWMSPDGSMLMKVKNAEQGLLEVAWVEEKEEKLKLESHLLTIRQSGPWLLGSLRDDAEEERYLWVRLKKDSRSLIVWMPSVDEFKVLVEAGVLPGKVTDGGDVMLGEMTEAHWTLITSGEKGVLLEWEEPLVLFRLGGK